MAFTPLFRIIDTGEAREGSLMLLFSDREEEVACLAGPGNPWEPARLAFPREELGGKAYLVGEETGESRPILCASRKDRTLPPGWEWIPFGEIYRFTPADKQFPLSRARQILHWERTHRYCGTCGAETVLSGHEPCRTCPGCGETFYPRMSPAVIVRITRGRRILLAHNDRFPENFYSNIAGFVEAGETLEETVRREVREEISLEVENIRYWDSQQWPMPHSLMLAFTAECPAGEPVPDGVEITDARWFEPEDLPLLPHPGSIARRMIDDHLARVAGT